MAWPKSSKACSVGPYLGSKWVVVPAPAHIPQEILSLQQPYMGKCCRLAARCCFHKFFLHVEGRGFPECPATWRRWRFHPEPPMTFFLLHEYQPSIQPLNRLHIEPVPDTAMSEVPTTYSTDNLSSILTIKGAVPFCPEDNNNASVRAVTFYVP